MFNPYYKQSGALEKFRIKAHLRSYVKDPVTVDEKLLVAAALKLKQLPYTSKDPAESVAIELLYSGYRYGCFKYDDLTEDGCKLVRQSRFRRHHRFTNDKTHHALILRNRFTLKPI